MVSLPHDLLDFPPQIKEFLVLRGRRPRSAGFFSSDVEPSGSKLAKLPRVRPGIFRFNRLNFTVPGLRQARSLRRQTATSRLRTR